MADDDEQLAMEAALRAVLDSPQIIVEELRLMASAGERYQRFTYMSPWVKNIWNAAADMIEGKYKNKLH